jgi:hypothetical protein
LLVAAGGFLWTNGEMWLVDWPGLDEECFYGGQRHRQLYLIVKCSLADGARGWLHLAYLALPIVVLAWWICSRRRALRLAGPDDQAGA